MYEAMLFVIVRPVLMELSRADFILWCRITSLSAQLCPAKVGGDGCDRVGAGYVFAL